MTRIKSDLLGKPATAGSVDANAADAVSGATYSYRALRDAVRSALENAPEAQGEETAVRYSVFYDLNGAPGDAPEALTYKPPAEASGCRKRTSR